jgi:hypothetical protein
MVHFLEISNNFIHRLIQEILLRRGMNSDNGILIMSARRISTDDDPSSCRPCLILQGQTIRNIRRWVYGKVCHVHREITLALWSIRGGGGWRAGRGNEFLGSGNGGRGGVFCSTRAIWGRNTVAPALWDSGGALVEVTRSHSEMGRSDWGTTLGFQEMTGRLLVKQNLNL